MSYKPEFWTRDVSERDKIMPAFGALATAEYRDFIEDPKTTETIDWRLQDPAYPSLVNRRNYLEDALQKLKFVADDVAFAADGRERGQNFYDKLTVEQAGWLKQNVFYGKNSVQFYKQLLAGGTQGVLYFAVGLADVFEPRTDEPLEQYEARFMDFLSGEEFREGLRKGAAAKQGFWNIPDTGTGLDEFRRIDIEKRDLIERLVDPSTPPEKAVSKIRASKHRANRAHDSFPAQNWQYLPSSGCPVRHERLGHVTVDQAFTDEQLDWIGSVATIDDKGSLTYTWDPFKAAQDLMVSSYPKVRLELS